LTVLLTGVVDGFPVVGPDALIRVDPPPLNRSTLEAGHSSSVFLLPECL
jgi:hypothetical protein